MDHHNNNDVASYSLEGTATRGIFLWTNFLNVPFWAVANVLLPFILYKDLHANGWQITLFTAIKPLSGLFSFYWGSLLTKRRDRLRHSLIIANLLKYLPFLTFPWTTNIWWFIGAYAFYMTLQRGAIPAWIEILKLNMGDRQRNSTFASALVIDYVGGAFLPLLLGWLLDDYPVMWRWLFFTTASIGIASTLLLYNLPFTATVPPSPLTSSPDSSHHLKQSLSNAYQLFCSSPGFTLFHLGFMLGGGGLILIHPALPSFFVDQLALSYTEIATVLTICKGAGFAITTPLWVRSFHRSDIFYFSSVVSLLAALFPFFLLGALWHLSWLYSAYIIYGIMLAGSELCWHMSSTLFARDSDSSPFSNAAVLMQGIRGCLIPPLGGFLCVFGGTTLTFLCGAASCSLASYILWRYGSIKVTVKAPS